MAHCRAQGILQLHCQMDSQQLVKVLISKSPTPEIYGVVSDILLLASSFLSISYEWFPRSKNKVADALAKQALYNAVSQSSSIDVGEHEMRPEGIKAAKASRNNGKGKAFEEYKSMWEMKMGDLAMKERLSKLAILDTLLAKKEPLSESEKKNYNG
ncbi:hypothetical protein DY000_02028670 [Brassica cretica]|uniref:RNase H type-1 domain-containing protein n=1 Tax=Brassica cretica TaxID=69181 RepID=A0ABQ7DPH4_BRACR|nr:hypothetical protein DY000_02028670 [Brassica cretica]